jgi:hypothetical protein
MNPPLSNPMQAELVDKLPEGDAWDYEAKFHGYPSTYVAECGARHGDTTVSFRR